MAARRIETGPAVAGRSWSRLLGLWLLASAGVLGLLYLVDAEFPIAGLIAWDHSIHDWVVARRSEWPGVTRFFLWVTRLGDPPFATAATLAAAAVLVLCHWRSIGGVGRYDALAWVGLILGSWGLGRALKSLFRRERPPLLNRLVVETAYSFPSGHSVFAGAFCTLAAVVACRAVPAQRPWLRCAAAALCLGAAAVVSLSRVWLGVHYPSDVLVGLVLGSTTSLGGWLVYNNRRGDSSSPDAQEPVGVPPTPSSPSAAGPAGGG